MKKFLLSIALLSSALMPLKAQDFFSTEDSETLFDFGVRVGVNTSNRTVANSVASLWNKNSWGLGFNAGAVVDLNFKNYISIQPGFFFESRSGDFTYQNTRIPAEGAPYVDTQVGKGREYNFTIPVVASVHFNITDQLRWNVDCGPYLQIKLKSTYDGKFTYPRSTAQGIEYYGNVRKAKCDFGLKMGTGLDIYEHYYVGVHYLAGFLHPWTPGFLGGHNKEWTFTIGYNF